LLIGGAGIARGYLNRPELTAEKFIRDPFSADPAARLYRTGDLARRLPDGQIAFVGRMDDQIKIRGFRIEPEEVAGALARHPHVRSAVVGARTGADGEKHLVAWLTGDALEPAVLGTFLSASLPDYMIPSAFVWLSELPLNASGKVDRAALPAPSERRVTPTDNGLEARLSTLVATLLKLKDVRRDDNFFLLGGHSLLGAQMIARIRDAFGVQLTLRNLFESPTVAKLAAAIERRTVAQAAGARK
jgi:acyl carrier protein